MNDDLTEREEQVAELLVEGKSTNEIARLLWITITTCRNHIQRIMEKLGVHSRVAAVAAYRNRRRDAATRVLNYCRRARIKLTPLQISLIRSALIAEQVHCEGDNHRWPQAVPGRPWTCLCGAIKLDPEAQESLVTPPE